MPANDAKLILLTGATRGLGRAMAARFVERGHTVIGCGRSQSGIESLNARYGLPHRFDCLDVSVDAQVAEWARTILSDIGPPDLLVNNAAVINGNAPLWKVSDEEFTKVVDVNIRGVANVIRHFVPAMVARGTGVIVNFSSGWGRSASPDVAPYCASKWAVEGLTKALAQELPHGMAAVPLNPGVINTEMLQSCFGPSAAQYSDADEWSRSAVPFLLNLNGTHNGEPLTVRF